MTLVKNMERSWVITWFSILLSFIVLVVFLISEAKADTITFQDDDAAFRIIDVRSEQGQLAIEVQHFNPDGTHWFYEVYSWQGREEYKHPRVANEQGQLLLEDGSVALSEIDTDGELAYYIPYNTIYFEKIGEENLPDFIYKVVHIDNAYGNLNTDLFQVGSTKQEVKQYQGIPEQESDLVWKYRNGFDWKRHDYPYLSQDSILDVITSTHKTRAETGWRGNLGRVVLPKLGFNNKDLVGSKALVSRFEYLAYQFPKVFGFDGSEYLGDTSHLAPIQEYFERVDLRTQNSKTYQINDNNFQTEITDSTHYKNSDGDWLESSLDFREIDGGWVMDTHPNYTVIGTESSLSMLSLEGDIGARWYTPSILTYSDNTASYTYDGLDWVYTLNPKGIKLASEVNNPRGLSSYPFVFLPLGNASPLSIDSNGNAVSGSIEAGALGPGPTYFYWNEDLDGDFVNIASEDIVVPRAVIIGADDKYYLGSTWEIVDDYTIKFTFDDSELPPEAFPYVIDPTTTFQPSVGDDTRILNYLATTNFATEYATEIGDNSDGTQRQNRILIKFDVTGIPSTAIVISSTFSLFEQAASDSASLDSWDADLHRVLRNWVEAEATWNVWSTGNSWSTAGAGHTTNDRSSTTTATLTLDGTAAGAFVDWTSSQLDTDVQNFIDGGASNYGWILQALTAENQGSNSARNQFYMSEHTTASERPKLTVTYAYSTLLACTTSTSVFYPDGHPESTSVDGYVRLGGFHTYADKWSSVTGSATYPSGANIQASTDTHSSGSDWKIFDRGFVLFDTNALPDDAVVSSATLSMLPTYIVDNFAGPAASISITNSFPDSNTNLSVLDYNNVGVNKVTDDRLLTDLDLNFFEHFNLNSFGRSIIDPEGISKFGTRITNDIDYWEPPHGTYKDRKVYFASAEETLIGDKRPYLTVEYITPCVSLSGTVSDSAISTFYSDTGTGSTTVDGLVRRSGVSESWGVLRSGAGTAASPGGSIANIGYTATGSTDLWNRIIRYIALFDTSALPNYSTTCTVNQTATIYPDSGTSGTTTDAYLVRTPPSYESWSAIRSGAGTQVGTGSILVELEGGVSSGLYGRDYRGIFTFDTGTALPDNAIVTSATFGIVVSSGSANDVLDGGGGFISMVGSTPASYSSLVVDDYNRIQNVKFADDLAIAGITDDSSTYNYFNLNTYGIQNIKVDGISSFGTAVTFDTEGNEPGWVIWGKSGVYIFSAERSGTSEDPKLTVNYDLPCPGIHSATFGFTVDSGSLIEDAFDDSLTLVSSTPADDDDLVNSDYSQLGAVGLSTDYPYGNIIDDAFTFSYMGLNDIGIASIKDTGISRFGLRTRYDADGIEPVWQGSKESLVQVLTVDAGAPKRPVLTVVHGDTSIPHIGASDIQTGGKTIILTLSGSQWITSGGTFDAQRQGIIDGLTGSLGVGAVNWDVAVSDDMAVTEVVRTSDTIVTITLAAHAAYNPASAETITATVPLAAILDGAGNLTSNPIFTIDFIPFEFTSFTPTVASNAGSFNMTVVGVGLPEHGFSGSEDVRLIKSGESDIVCTSVSGTGGTSVVVSCPVTGAVVGTWDVKVTESAGLNDTKSAALTLYQPWSSTVNGGGFNDSGSDYAVFAHDASPYFTVQAFDEVDKEWDSSSIPPTSMPAAPGLDAQFTSDVDPSFNGKDRLVIGTASNANALWAYEFNPSTGVIGGVSNPSTGAVSMDINDLDIGTGDNIVVVATDGGDYIYMYDIDESAAIASFWTNEITVNPATLPGAECNTVDINANATYVAVGCTASPYLHVWAITNGGSGTPSWGAKVADPGTTPLGVINGVKFSPDGTQIAIAIDTAPYVEVYEFNGGAIGDKASWTVPVTTPTGIGYDVDWLKENITGDTNLAVAHAVTPFVTVYPFDTDTGVEGIFGVKLDDPGTLPTGTASSVGFHPNGDTIFVGHASSPYVTAYNFTGVSDDDYRVYRYALNFDTSYIPTDAVITSAVLSIYVDSVNVGTDWQLMVQDGVNNSEPLVVGDYDYLSHVGGSLGFITASAITTSAYNEIVLGSYGAIDPDGITQFMLRHEEDIGNTAPTVVETVDIEVGNSVTFPEDCLTSSPATLRSNSLYNLCNSSNVPRLRVTYTSASAVSPELATLQVELLDSHTANADGTHTTTVVSKGPVVFLDVSTSPTTSIFAFDLNRSIVNSTDDWSFLSSSVGSPFPFMKNFKAYNDDGVTQTLWYEMNSEPKAQMQDRSGLDHHSSYYSFPVDSTSVESLVGIILPREGSSISIGEGAGVPSMADDTSDSDMVMVGTSNTSNTGLPLEGFFDYIEEAGGMPSGIVKLMFAMVVTILAGLIAFKSFQSVAACYIAMLMSIVAFTLGLNGVFEWWMLLTFGLTGGIFIFTRRAYV